MSVSTTSVVRDPVGLELPSRKEAMAMRLLRLAASGLVTGLADDDTERDRNMGAGDEEGGGGEALEATHRRETRARAMAARHAFQEKRKKESVRFVICHLSFVPCPLSFVICHLSLVICHLSFVL